MSVDPSDTSTGQLSTSHKLRDFAVRDRGCPMHFRIGRQKFRASTTLADQKLAIDEVMAENFVAGQESVQLARERLFSSQEPDPNRGVD